uniref:B(0,+)-type amino acid transporter 1 n=1 Tax=Equus asinus asinus TaxID=83772 RepID=A0A8C4PKZ9_EQUAS
MQAVPLQAVCSNHFYLLMLSPTDILSSNAVEPGSRGLGLADALGSCAVDIRAVNGIFFSGSRVCYVAAREGHVPQLLSMVHVHRLTPAPAMMFTTAVALVLIILGNFSTTVNCLSFLIWLTNGITISCLLYLWIKRNLPRTYKVPTVISAIMLFASLYLVLAPIIDHPQTEFLYIFLFLLSGFLVYFLFVYFRCQPKYLQMTTLHLQLLLEVVLATENAD